MTEPLTQAPADLASDSYLEAWDSRAKAAYDMYGDAVGWRNFAGQPMPVWDALPRRIRAAWCLSTEKMWTSTFSLAAFFDEKKEWSLKTFGPGDRYTGVVEHIRSELKEIERNPSDLVEWVDVVLLAMDGAWRSARADGKAFTAALSAKQEKNVCRKWPDWRTLGEGTVSRHLTDHTTHCCEQMAHHAESQCLHHEDRADCPDALVRYFPKLREYGLWIHDGGQSSVGISFCPWCGASLEH